MSAVFQLEGCKETTAAQASVAFFYEQVPLKWRALSARMYSENIALASVEGAASYLLDVVACKLPDVRSMSSNSL